MSHIFIGLNTKTNRHYDVETYKEDPALYGTPIFCSEGYLDGKKIYKRRVVKVRWENKSFECNAIFPANNFIGLVDAQELQAKTEQDN